MRGKAFMALGLGLALIGAPAKGAEPPDPALELAAKIDKAISAGWQKHQVKAAPPTDDAAFLRRAYLHLAGRIPSVSETRAFLADQRPNKRHRVIRDLLEGARYVSHFTTVWSRWMIPEADANVQARFLVPGFEGWLREKLRANTPYDRIAIELLTTSTGAQGPQAGFISGMSGGPSPSAYYLAKEMKAENLAASTARLFLGIRLECAQCHHHPFADWKREQFWSYAAFFSGIRGQMQGDFVAPMPEQQKTRKIAIPNTDKTVPARFPDGKEPAWKEEKTTRQTLADWMVAKDNPYFARAAVNRMWDYFFGVGLIEPFDEMAGVDAKPSHPELLDQLARSFIEQKYDLKFLIRAITSSHTYQLSSLRTDPSQADTRQFARFPARGLTAEQLYDSVSRATGYQEGGGAPQGFVVFGDGRSARQEFITRFHEQSAKATESQTSILQALALMNGKLIDSATSLDRSETLLAITDNPFMTREERIETLYLAALSRFPRAKELDRMKRFLDEAIKESKEAEREKREKQAYADIFWTLLNGSEFVLNH